MYETYINNKIMRTDDINELIHISVEKNKRNHILYRKQNIWTEGFVILEHHDDEYIQYDASSIRLNDHLQKIKKEITKDYLINNFNTAYERYNEIFKYFNCVSHVFTYDGIYLYSRFILGDPKGFPDYAYICLHIRQLDTSFKSFNIGTIVYTDSDINSRLVVMNNIYDLYNDVSLTDCRRSSFNIYELCGYISNKHGGYKYYYQDPYYMSDIHLHEVNPIFDNNIHPFIKMLQESVCGIRRQPTCDEWELLDNGKVAIGLESKKVTKKLKIHYTDLEWSKDSAIIHKD